MAIQTGVITFRKKLGNVVGFGLPNSKTAGATGARIYQSQVANPKTEAQSIQRMKMTAAVNFYRPLTEILNNAWQGQKYGTKSRNYFMKMAMSQAEGIPFIQKGDKRFYPGLFPVSQGSLPTQGITGIAANLATTTLSVGDLTTDESTSWAEVSQAIINNSFGVLDGDKVTFIGVGVVNGEYTPMYSYFIINTSSEQTVGDVISGSKMRMLFSNGALQLGFEQLDTEVAAAIIVSRFPKSGGSWLRSTSTMFVREDYRSQLMGTVAYQEALPTYMAAYAKMSSDWYLNRGLTGSGSDATWAEGGSNLSVVSSTNDAITYNGSSVTGAMLTMSDGSVRLAKSQAGFLAFKNMSDQFVYVNSANYEATAALLAAWKAEHSEITTWQTVQATVDDDPIENRP